MSARREIASTGEFAPRLGYAVVLVLVAAFAIPFCWMLVAAFRPGEFGASGMASLIPDYLPTLANFREAWGSADFIRYTFNTVVICGGILVVQVVTMSLAAYAFARLKFPGRAFFFYLFLMQLMLVPIVLLVPNLRTVAQLGLYDTLLGVMAPYFATAFGTFLMRQAFQSIPVELEDAALMDGARWWHLILYIYLPLSKPALIAFSIVSVTAHWNEFLWPLMVINSPDNRPLTVGLATFTRGAEGAQAWGVIAAGTFIVIAPLIIGFVLFQRRFINSFMTTGLK
jgi:sn-glycerol 3-phosphate transport system permease protein